MSSARRGNEAEPLPRGVVTACTLLLLGGGASALAYEVIWVRVLTLSFGVSVYAVSAVLTAFMAGLGLGSWVFGQVADRVGRGSRRPAVYLRIYAGLQIGLGAWALLTPALFEHLTQLYVQIHRTLDPGFYQMNLIRFALAILVLLPPTILMGGTLPILSQMLAVRQRGRGRILGTLYAANTLGGVLGVLACGFMMIRLLGVHASLMTVAGVDLAIAAIALIVSSRPALSAGISGQPPSGTGCSQPSLTGAARFVLWGFGLSGFAALGYEVVWFRLLAIMSLNAVFSFSIMLGTFLVGLTLGSALASAAADRIRDPLRSFGLLQLGIGLCGVLTLLVFSVLPSLVDGLITSDTVAKKTFAEFLGAGLAMLVPTILMGAMLPVAARIVSSGARDVGSRIGRLYAGNTTGSMMGALLTGLVLIGAVGLQRSALLLASVNLAIGSVALLWLSRTARGAVAASVVSAIIVAILLPRGVYLGFNEPRADKLVFYEEGAEATVSVFEGGSPFIRVSYVNGRSEVPTDPVSMRTFYILGHLPALLKPEARSALMVSFGNGIATGALSRHRVPRIQTVELVEAQTRAAELYSLENRNVLSYPGLAIAIDDGRNYVLRSDETFDIITADSTHPINTSSWALFTREFYERVRERLASDGVFIQWLPFHDLSLEDYRSIIATFMSVFPNTTLWYGGGPHTFMLATPGPLERNDIEGLDSIMRARGVGDDLQDGELLRRAFLMEKQDVKRYVADAPIVRDDTAFFVPAVEMEQVLESLARFRTRDGSP